MLDKPSTSDRLHSSPWSVGVVLSGLIAALSLSTFASVAIAMLIMPYNVASTDGPLDTDTAANLLWLSAVAVGVSGAVAIFAAWRIKRPT